MFRVTLRERQVNRDCTYAENVSSDLVRAQVLRDDPELAVKLLALGQVAEGGALRDSVDDEVLDRRRGDEARLDDGGEDLGAVDGGLAKDPAGLGNDVFHGR